MSKKIVIVGASGHGKVVADIAKNNGYDDIVFLDDNCSLKECNGYSVVGTIADADKYKERDYVVAIGNATIRQGILNSLFESNVNIVSLIHPNAVIGENVSLGKGTVVMAGAVVNPSVRIGTGCIINTCASVDHDCILEDYVHISVGAHVAGTATIGEKTMVGAGAIIINNIEITRNCIIGAGAVVVSNIVEDGKYAGVPARKMIK